MSASEFGKARRRSLRALTPDLVGLVHRHVPEPEPHPDFVLLEDGDYRQMTERLLGGIDRVQGLVDLRLRLLALESDLPACRAPARDRVRLAPQLLPAPDPLARDARRARPDAGAGSRRCVQGRLVPSAGGGRSQGHRPLAAARDQVPPRRQPALLVQGAFGRTDRSPHSASSPIGRQPYYRPEPPLDETVTMLCARLRTYRLVRRIPCKYRRLAGRARHLRPPSVAAAERASPERIRADAGAAV